jgi:hypothetical protein
MTDTVNPVPLRIVPFLEETPLSILQRLYRRSEIESFSDFLSATDLKSHFARRGTINWTIIQLLSEKTGISVSRLCSAHFYNDSHGTRVGDKVISKYTPYKALINLGRVCPRCLEEDLEHPMASLSPTTHRRWYWDFKFIDFCALHMTRLVSNCKSCGNILQAHNPDPRYCTCGTDLIDMFLNKKPSPDRLDYYIAARLIGCREPSGGEILDKMALLEAFHLVTHAARTLPPTDSTTLSTRDVAFSAISNWSQLGDAFLDRVVGRDPLLKQKEKLYFPLDRWLYHCNYPEYEAVRYSIGAHYQKIFGIPQRKPRQFRKDGKISIGYAQKLLGCSISLIKLIGCDLHLFPIESLGSLEYIEKSAVEKIQDEIYKYIRIQEAGKHLNEGRGSIEALIRSNALVARRLPGKKQWFIEKASLDPVLSMIDCARHTKRADIKDSLNSLKIARKLHLGIGDLIKKAMDAGIRPSGIDTAASGVKAIEFSLAEIRGLFCEHDRKFKERRREFATAQMRQGIGFFGHMTPRESRSTARKTQCRSNAISSELRERVMKAVEDGSTQSAAAERYGVSKASVCRWYASRRAEGGSARSP